MRQKMFTKIALFMAVAVLRVVIGPLLLDNASGVFSSTAAAMVQASPLVQDAQSTAQQQISITDVGFSPATITIIAGDSIAWKNNSNVAHTLQSGTPPSAQKVYMPLIWRNSNVATSSNQVDEQTPTEDTSVVESTQPNDFISILAPGAEFSFTFSVPGEYPFYLATAPQFKGRIIVRPPTPAECVIDIGGGGETHTFSAQLLPGKNMTWSSVPASDFIRSTRGPCHFTIYNQDNFGGRFVTLGSNLVERIRAGLHGIENKDFGGGETWRIRSLVIERVDTSCTLFIGGAGVRMDYYNARLPSVPAMNRVSWFLGGDCRATVWNGTGFGEYDSNNRFKSFHPTGLRSDIYDPGFAVRSLIIWNEWASCPTFANDEGRCLPQAKLLRSIYDVQLPDDDRDQDGLVDALENELAMAFRPIYVNHSTEDATRVDVYHTVTGESMIEPVTIYQVRPVQDGEIVIVFMKLWLEDKYEGLFCRGHQGDSQQHSVVLRMAPRSNSFPHGTYWYIYQTTAGIDDDLKWEQSNGSIRGVTFEKWPGEQNQTGTANHLVIYFTKGKHHEYADAGWSGQWDKSCPAANAYIDSRGHLHNPPLPKRIAIIRSPQGRGDRFDFTNVGSKLVPFFDDLEPYGFPGQRVWSCQNFYDAACVCREFERGDCAFY